MGLEIICPKFERHATHPNEEKQKPKKLVLGQYIKKLKILT